MSDLKLIESKKHHFSINIPSDWKGEFIDDKGILRFTASDNSSKKYLLVYVLKAEGQVSLLKLSEINTKIIKDIGGLHETITLPVCSQWLGDRENITKIFKKNKKTTLFYYKAQGSYGFIVVFRGNEKFVDEFKAISKTLSTLVPIDQRVRPGFNNLFAIILASFLGFSGFRFRKALFLRKILDNIKDNPGINKEKVKKTYCKETFILCVIPFCCLLAYSIGFLFLLPNIKYIFVIIGPILPFLGYIGIYRDVDDGDVPLKI